MKKPLYGIIVAVMLITACQPKTPTVDIAAAKDAVTKTLEKYHSALNNRDANTANSLIAADGLFCGTDSKEFWDTPAFTKEMTQMLADTVNAMKYSIDKREIRLAADGNSAISIEQCIVKNMKIPLRMVSHLVKAGKDWKFDFFSASLIPNNEDLGKLNKALE
jgi:ketosteroid isomerase-like protein